MLKIVIDPRESRSEVYRVLRTATELQIEVRELSSGDYLLRSDFAVERKEARDFLASIVDRRLFVQAARLKNEYERILFIVEGSPYAVPSAIAPEAIRGALSYLMTVEGVSLMSTLDARDTAELLQVMARHLQKGLGYEVALRGNKPKNLSDLSQFLVEGLPGVGPSGAKTLLSYFGSALAVFNASVKELSLVKGIGPKSAERIEQALRYKNEP